MSSIPRPSVGRIVHVRESWPLAGCRAALVVDVQDGFDGEDRAPHVTVVMWDRHGAPRTEPLLQHTLEDDGPQYATTWHWPEREEGTFEVPDEAVRP